MTSLPFAALSVLPVTLALAVIALVFGLLLVRFWLCPRILKNKKEILEASFYKDVSNLYSSPVCRFGLDGHIHFANDKYCQLVGQDRATIYQSSIFDILPENQHQKLQECVNEVYKKNVNVHFSTDKCNVCETLRMSWDLVPVQKENQTVAIQANGHPLKSGATHSSDLEKFFSISPELLSIIKRDGYFQLANPAFEATLGWTQTEILARPFIHFIHPDDREQSKLELLKPHQHTLQRFTNRFLCKNGNYRAIEWSFTPSDDGELHYASGRDVTKQRQAESQLKQSESRFRNLFRDSPDPIIVFGHSGEILDANPELCRLLEIDQTALNEQSIETLMPRKWWSDKALSFDDIGSDEVQKFQAACSSKKHSSIPVEVTVSRIYFKNKLAFLFHLRDITERKKTEDTLIQSKAAAEAGNRAKSEFLAVMSHEIRTPLNAILGFSQLLYDEVTPDQKVYIERILAGGEHLLSIINDILDYSKMESRRLTLEPSDFDIHKLIKDIINIFSVSAQEKNLTLQADIDPDLPATLVGDKQRLKQVIYNLVGNAIKFTPKGAITVRIKHLKATEKFCYLRIAVIDTGIGIPESKHASIFRPFTQVDQGIKRVHEGSGLGLAISQKIVAAMGGKIQCKSGLDEGSEFFFEIKLKKFEEDLFSLSAKRMRVEQNSRTPNDHAFNLKTLVVEDDRSNSYLIGKFLKRLGCDIKVVENGKQAIKAHQEEAFDLIVMDVAMPEMNGIEATQKILNSTATDKHPHILGITANIDGNCEKRCLQAGMNGFLAKPISFKKFHQYMLDTYQSELKSSP